MLLEITEDTELGSKTSSMTRLAKNSSLLVDIAEDVEVGEDNGGDDETVERSLLFKKPNVPTGYQLKALLKGL